MLTNTDYITIGCLALLCVIISILLKSTMTKKK